MFLVTGYVGVVQVQEAPGHHPFDRTRKDPARQTASVAAVRRLIPLNASIFLASSWLESMLVVAMLACPANSETTSFGAPSTSACRTNVCRIQCVLAFSNRSSPAVAAVFAARPMKRLTTA